MKTLLQQIAREYGTPCYVYSFDEVLARIALLREAFGGRFQISYAVKSNPNSDLLRRLRGQIESLDISSAGELKPLTGGRLERFRAELHRPRKTRG